MLAAISTLLTVCSWCFETECVATWSDEGVSWNWPGGVMLLNEETRFG